ncbi:hypothetical protein [Bradyrhizobium genosp. SA-3]|uniref:hypothetical protein n=1 Tax=Bradyrhizobium genosp. SA-3 TaxID=508868 RepID=UPI0026B9ED74
MVYGFLTTEPNAIVELVHPTAGLIEVAASADLIGQASIIDGDAIELYGTRIRLWGIDAPESSQRSRGS